MAKRYRMAIDSGLAPLILFAERLKKYLRGILASSRFPMSTRILEGVNNRIKVIRRMAYGFRDPACFFLKIKDAFPRENAMNLFYGVVLMQSMRESRVKCTRLKNLLDSGREGVPDRFFSVHSLYRGY